MTNHAMDPMYPDVLGMIAPIGTRITLDALQMALGVFPRAAYLNQPFEVVAILQSMIDQPLQIRLAMQLPTRDPAGRMMNISTGRKMVDIGLRGGEVGVLRIPVVALSPTQPGEDYPIQVAVRFRPVAPGNIMRPVSGGPPASVLTVSPFKLQVLKDIPFVQHPASHSPENVSLRFDVAPRRLPDPPESLKPTYETLWTIEQLAQEQKLLEAKVEQARLLASSFTRQNVFNTILREVQTIFADRGLPLHPGEATAIAKMVTYTLDDSATFEMVSLEDTRWFRTLAQTLAANPDAANWEPADIVTEYLLQAALYDSIVIAFGIVRPRVRVNMGDRAEREVYANRVMTWLSGTGDSDLTYAYLPLVMGGIAVNSLVMGREDDPWEMIDQVREAVRGRQRLSSGAVLEIFDMVERLLIRAEDDLRRLHIRRLSR
jgi:hypothetical protein